jgi:hypothetical protein
MKKSALRRDIDIVILYSMVFWPFIWGNVLGAYNSFRLIRLPSVLMYLMEVALILACMAFSMISIKRNSLEILWFIGILAIAGLFSGIINGSQPQALLRTTYMHIRPLIIFFIILNLGMPERYIRKVFIILTVILLINVSVAYFQRFVMGLSGDKLCGMMRDSHYFAFFLWNGVFFALSYILVRKKHILRFSIFIIFLLFPIFVAGFIQGMLLAFPVIGAGILIYAVVKIKRPGVVVAMILVMSLMSFTVYEVMINYHYDTKLVMEYIVPNIGKLGFVQAPLDLIRAFSQQPQAMILGFGPGRFASQYAITHKEADRNPLAEAVYQSYHMSSDGGLFLSRPSVMSRTSVYISIISEYGLIGFVVVVLFLYKIFSFMLFMFQNPPSKFVSFISLGSLMALIYVLMFFITSLRDGYQDPGCIFPLMILSGLIYSNYAGMKLEKKRYRINASAVNFRNDKPQVLHEG